MAIPALYFAFLALRNVQLTQDDPYNNPYTNISTRCLDGVFLAWLIEVIFLIAVRKRLATWVWWVTTPILLCATLFIVVFLWNLFRFLFL